MISHTTYSYHIFLIFASNLFNLLDQISSQEFWSHGGDYSTFWDSPLPRPSTEEEFDENCKSLTIAQVYEWAEVNHDLEGRFRFWQVYMPHSKFYQRVARPLLSMRTTGSIDVERVAKPFKHHLLRKERNRLSDEKGVVLFRASQNLRHLMKAKQELKGKLHDARAFNAGVSSNVVDLLD